MEQEKGFSFSKKRKLDADQVGDSTSRDINHKVGDQVTVKDSSGVVVYKRRKITEMPLTAQTTGVSPSVIDWKTSSPNNAAPVIKAINMKKGGPRSALFALCMKQQWPKPGFKITETQSRTPFTFGESSTKYFNSFVAQVILHIPNSGVIECTGDARPDKGSSEDSAAVVLFQELQRQGRVVIAG